MECSRSLGVYLFLAANWLSSLTAVLTLVLHLLCANMTALYLIMHLPESTFSLRTRYFLLGVSFSTASVLFLCNQLRKFKFFIVFF